MLATLTDIEAAIRKTEVGQRVMGRLLIKDQKALVYIVRDLMVQEVQERMELEHRRHVDGPSSPGCPAFPNQK